MIPAARWPAVAGPAKLAVMEALPPGVTAYKKTATFTETTAPAGLTAEHRTKAGVWGVINVVSGALDYTIPATGETHRLTPENPGIVEPEVEHFVRPEGAVVFFVEFYR